MIYQIVDKDGRLLQANYSAPAGLHIGSVLNKQGRYAGRVFKITRRDSVTGEVAAYVR